MKLSTGRRPWVSRLGRFISPRAAVLSFFALMGISLVIGMAANVISIQQMLRAGGHSAPVMVGMAAMGTPKPYQFENRVRIHSERGTTTLPVHQGSVDLVAGPVTLLVADGATLVWEPGAEIGGPTLSWVFAISSVDGVQLSGVGGGTYTLSPGAYLPSITNLPLSIVNSTGHDAHVTLVIGCDYDGGEEAIL